MAPPTVTVTVLPVSAVPPMIGVALLLSAALVTAGALGAVVSIVSVWVPAVEVLLDASRAVTDTALVPLALRLSDPEAGVAVARLIDQLPLVAVVV
ncbi:hypothetical protein ABAZ39_20940 (plasmid) [Azospirillum argentinense]|uniref:Uncharacterized protein n=1 Tax=Azospirillum argentinense TaxID=2970906 RepID=A0A060DNT9_9PROT|nr:hypothetical protein [Azospirillum argentinense]AIB14385.1 hypothetical protein ABAZ39_20940 [Azospirillum argentinense]